MNWSAPKDVRRRTHGGFHRAHAGQIEGGAPSSAAHQMTRVGIEQIPDGKGEHTFRTNVACPHTTPVMLPRWTDRDLTASAADWSVAAHAVPQAFRLARGPAPGVPYAGGGPV
jgi:hypothetical protein